MTATEFSGQASAVDLDQIVADLDSHKLEVVERGIRAAQANREAIVPKLIEAIRTATHRAQAGDIPPGGSQMLAAILLAEFQAREALPAIIEAITLPSQLVDELYGDFITELLPRVLAVLCCDQPEVLDLIIANHDVDGYVRWSACTACVRLVAQGRIERADVVRRLTGYLREAVAECNDTAAAGFVSSLLYLGACESSADIRAACETGLVDEMFDWKYAEGELARGAEGLNDFMTRYGPSKIEDTFEEIRDWHWGEPPPLPEPPSLEPWPETATFSERNRLYDDIETPFSSETPKLNRVHAANRNDPCPCGSGKKFKKCCGASQGR
jgi:hypothetical protein